MQIKIECKKHFLVAIGFFFVSLFVYQFNIMHGLYVDELYHLLPAQSLLHDGSLSVGNGEYVRAEIYTRLIAMMQSLFGETIAVARMSSAVTMSIFIALIYYVLRLIVGVREAAVISGVLMVLPGTIYLAQFVRFYALHQLCFFIGVLSVYCAVTRWEVSLKAKLATISTGLLFLYVAYLLQVSTLIGLVGVGVWCTLYILFKVFSSEKRIRFQSTLLISGGLLGLVSIGALISTSHFSSLFQAFRYAAPWNAEHIDNYLFYHKLFRYQYPTFWTLYPIACLVSLSIRPRFASFCISLFVGSLFLFSLGGMKDERYILFLVPFFVIVWVICLFPVFLSLHGLARSLIRKVSPLVLTVRVQKYLSSILMICIAFFVLAGNHAFPISYHMLQGKQYRHEIGDWSLSRTKVQALIDKAEVVVTSNDVESLYYFGRYDFNFSEFIYSEANDQKRAQGGSEKKKFIVDKRTGLPAIGDVATLKLVMACYSSGVFLGDSRKWYKKGQGVGQEGVALLEEMATPVRVESKSRLTVFAWESSVLAAPEVCHDAYYYRPQQRSESE